MADTFIFKEIHEVRKGLWAFISWLLAAGKLRSNGSYDSKYSI